MQILRFEVGDILQMRKVHPCGNAEFSVLRVGSDIKVRCNGCGRDMTMPREKIERMIKKVLPKDEEV